MIICSFVIIIVIAALFPAYYLLNNWQPYHWDSPRGGGAVVWQGGFQPPHVGKETQRHQNHDVNFGIFLPNSGIPLGVRTTTTFGRF